MPYSCVAPYRPVKHIVHNQRHGSYTCNNRLRPVASNASLFWPVGWIHEMPKMVSEMSPIEIKRLRHPGRGGIFTVAVGGVSGLLLQIAPTGARSWVLRTLIGGARRSIGLGPYPEVSLAVARDKAREAKEKVRQGIDPIEEKKTAQAALVAAQRRGLIFADAFERYCEAKLVELGSDRDRVRWRSSIQRYALPELGPLLVQDIEVQDVLRALAPVWGRSPDTGKRVRARIEAILAWATVAGHRKGDNPARWRHNLDKLLPAPGKVAVKGHQPAIALDEAAAWFAELRKCGGTGAKALEFLTLCASRSGEVRGAVWDEFDLTAKVWTIPKERMKAEREHRVPLTDPALAIIEAMPRMADSPFVFAAPRGGMLSDMTLSKVMRDLQERAEREAQRAGLDPEKAGWRDPRSGRPAVPHGLRSTFRDWTAEKADWPREMAEIALAHNVGSEVERAYRRSDLLERRRAMMVEWAKFLGAC